MVRCIYSKGRGKTMIDGLKDLYNTWYRELEYVSGRLLRDKSLTTEERIKLQGERDGLNRCINDLFMFIKYNP